MYCCPQWWKLASNFLHSSFPFKISPQNSTQLKGNRSCISKGLWWTSVLSKERKINVLGTSNTDFINNQVLEISLFPQWRGKMSVCNESSESEQCWRDWRCRQAPNPRGTNLFIYFCSQKHWKMPIPKLRVSWRTETPWWPQGYVEGPRKMALLSHPRGGALWIWRA